MTLYIYIYICIGKYQSVNLQERQRKQAEEIEKIQREEELEANRRQEEIEKRTQHRNQYRENADKEHR